MGNRVAVLDSLFFNFDTPVTHQAIASLCLFDGLPDVLELRSRLRVLAENVPKLRQRIIGDMWVDDAEFNIANHFAVLCLPEISNREKLVEVASEKFSERLNLSRPLWSFTLISNVAERRGGREIVGMLFVIHHALADGLGGLELIEAIADDNFGAELDRGKRLESRNDGIKAAKLSARGLEAFKRNYIAELFREIAAKRPKSLLNGRNSPRRVIRVFDLPVEELRAIRRKVDVSFNDVLLGCVIDGIIRYHYKYGASVKGLRAVVPVNVRPQGDRLSLGNRIVALAIDLHLQCAVREERLRLINRRFVEKRDSKSLYAYLTLGELISILPRWLQRILCEWQARRTNFIFTNMPGWIKERRLCGAKILANYPVLALIKGHGAAFGFISHEEKLCACVVTDPNIVREPQLLASCVKEAVEELIKGRD
ncbi:MAG: DUF1298 domain-containing protein [Deltaproteobacteria bacterium]|nr:DUF1298 domain-containing protein [Deltaproteobacteria bacterium]